ncbi:MAG: VOC family protein [Gemmataceae bacterium]|nr:VOC family protein [Gemmataceae bacterium]MCI0742012.1 VOC family protein [Gemmataceae bacterium]
MSISLNLLVIRGADIARAQRFYEALGLRFTREQHGKGPEHLAAELDGVVFEIYPLGKGPATDGVRLGFRVPSIESALSSLQQEGAHVATPPVPGPWGLRAVVIDPDGHKVELAQADEQ